MKKLILSITVIAFTIISCTYMLTYHVPEKVNSKKPNLKVSVGNDSIAGEEKTVKGAVKQNDKATDKDTMKSDSNLSDINTQNDIPIPEEAKSVFKISKSSISISSKEKLKLLYIFKKLDKSDEEKLTEFLNQADEDSVKNIFHMLRDRLSDDDYKSVRDISSRFINLDVAEN